MPPVKKKSTSSAAKKGTIKKIPKAFVERVQRWNLASKKLSKEAEGIRKEAAKRGIDISIRRNEKRG